ncbi:MAG: sigma 54-interacting transcriptional regulator [Planctomycetota bacterium]|nr:sigma 54-interacting transcriptional regulator [Planctomycetota bacterium]
MVELRIDSEGRQWTVPLTRGDCWRIGRDEGCEIRVPDRRVSGQHAELVREGARLTLRRTRGQKPIEIDGRAVEAADLASGASFAIGHSTFTLVARVDGMDLIDAPSVLACAFPEPAEAAAAGAPVVASASAQASPMRLMAQLIALLGRAHDRQDLAAATLDLACQRLNAARAVLARIEDNDHLDVIAARGMPAYADAKQFISTTVLKQIIDERKAVLIGDTATSVLGLSRQESVVRNHIRAVACTPVFNTQRALVALLYVDNQDRPSEFTTQDGEMLIWAGQVWSLLDENLAMRRRLEAEVMRLKQNASSVQMVAEAPAMLRLLERVKRAAASDAAVLIEGESGTGKECIARMLHELSPVAQGRFVARNCAAIPPTLFESEMFGHVRGAFTGADHVRKGAFLEAHGGTLFLDEIGDLEYSLQTKLLRAIQERAVRPVGSDHDVPVNARIVCATNRDLREGFANRSFREDLFYRVATVTLTVPALRERPEDILPLARYFTRLLSQGTRALTPAAEERLLTYVWPGNVRELRSVVEQAVIFAAGSEIQADELNLPSSAAGLIVLTPQSMAEVERRHILQVLKNTNGNKSEAARILGLARSTLNLKLQGFRQATG